MDLMQSEDQDAIQETVRSFLAVELPLERARRRCEGGDAVGLAEVWRRAGGLGFFGLGLSEDEGGSGFALTEEMILFNELGRSLAPGPWLGSVLAAHALSDESRRAAVLAGEHPCAYAEPASDDTLEIAAGRVSGEISRVADLEVAAGLLLYADGSWLYVARPDGGWQAETLRSLDPTRTLSRLTLRDTAETLLAGDDAACLRRVATVLSCAEAVGGIEQTVEMSVEYCKVRTQFGKPIGSFQAVKHRCADMAVRAEMARSATIYATVCVRDGLDDAAHQVSVAKLLCGDAYLQNCADNIQNHGGMGFTWECDAHLYLKRAHAFDVSLGARKQQLDALVAGIRA